MSLTELLHYLRLGGVTMALLLLASIVALGVAIERLIALWGISERSRTLGETVPLNATIQNAQIRTQEIDQELARLGGVVDAPPARTEIRLAAEQSHPGLGAPRPIGEAQ